MSWGTGRGQDRKGVALTGDPSAPRELGQLDEVIAPEASVVPDGDHGTGTGHDTPGSTGAVEPGDPDGVVDNGSVDGIAADGSAVDNGERPDTLPGASEEGDPAPATGRRRLGGTLARTGAVLVVVAAVLAVAIVALNSSAAHPAAVPSTTQPPQPTSLPFSSAPAVVQPPVAASPLAPGEPVDSGQNQSDPFVLETRGRYFLYTSNTTPNFTTNVGMNVPVTSSTDFASWGPVTDAMPVLPAWVEKNFTWAPDVHQFGSTYVLYFTGFFAWGNEQCIGAATSTSPTGPFTAQNQPFICQSALSGSIDPRVFTDNDGTNWMLWKSDQNAHGKPDPTTLWSQRLTADGLGLVGTANDLMSPDEAWQGTIVEAPDMVEVNGVYWMLYSANWFNQPAYGIGVAFCAGPAGPCADTSDQPVLGTNLQGQGPGEASFFRNDSGIWILYTPVRQTTSFPSRPVDITRVGFAPGTGPYLAAGAPPGALKPGSSSP